MGYRTVLVLNNDQSSAWGNDPDLGKKIQNAASMKSFSTKEHYFPYGSIIEQVHADTQTLAVIDSIGGDAVAYTHWTPSQTEESLKLQLLKDFADKMGFRLVKKSKPK